MKIPSLISRGMLRRLILGLAISAVFVPLRIAFAVGSWTNVVDLAPNSPNGRTGHMLLLSDGTVMVQNYDQNPWFRLSPDTNGSYVTGKWSTNTYQMSYSRGYYSSAVLTDGRVFVAGGEFGEGWRTAEVYDPLANKWTTLPPVPDGLIQTYSPPPGGPNHSGFSDSECTMLPDGNVLVAPVYPVTNFDTLIYDPHANAWSEASVAHGDQGEASWVKLPDDSILTINYSSQTNDAPEHSERYIPSLNRWVVDADVPAGVFWGGEIGAGFLLHTGKAIFLGAGGRTAIYTPSGSAAPGSWVRGPDIPNGMVAPDAPACMMVNGKILCVVVSPANHSPMFFYEYDPVANLFITNVLSPTGGFRDSFGISDGANMLALPDGNVMFSDSSRRLYIYHPDGLPLAAGKPTINTITANWDGSYLLTGTRLNGISVGAAFGDDAQMDSNYPLVRVTDGSGNIHYLRTYNWSSTSVMTGSRVSGTSFTLPVDFSGVYSLVVVANGISSDPVSFHGPIWVDFNYTGLFQLGTYGLPYKTLVQGINAVSTGGTIKIKTSGTSSETMTISKAMTIVAVGGPATIGRQ